MPLQFALCSTGEEDGHFSRQTINKRRGDNRSRVDDVEVVNCKNRMYIYIVQSSPVSEVCNLHSNKHTRDDNVVQCNCCCCCWSPTPSPSPSVCWSQTTALASCAIFCTLACRFIVMENHSQFNPTITRQPLRCKCSRPECGCENRGEERATKECRRIVQQLLSTLIPRLNYSFLFTLSGRCCIMCVLSYCISILWAVGDRVFLLCFDPLLVLTQSFQQQQQQRQECINKSCNYFPTQSANSINNFCTYFTATTRKPRTCLIKICTHLLRRCTNRM